MTQAAKAKNGYPLGEATPCDECGTAYGYQYPTHRKPSRRNARPFGGKGMACAQCFRQLRTAALAADRDPCPVHVGPAEVAETTRAIREEWATKAAILRPGETPADAQRRRWAELAERERRQVVDARQRRMAS